MVGGPEIGRKPGWGSFIASAHSTPCPAFPVPVTKSELGVEAVGSVKQESPANSIFDTWPTNAEKAKVHPAFVDTAVGPFAPPA